MTPFQKKILPFGSPLTYRKGGAELFFLGRSTRPLTPGRPPKIGKIVRITIIRICNFAALKLILICASKTKENDNPD